MTEIDVSITLENAQRVGKYLNTTAGITATVIELNSAPHQMRGLILSIRVELDYANKMGARQANATLDTALKLTR